MGKILLFITKNQINEKQNEISVSNAKKHGSRERFIFIERALRINRSAIPIRFNLYITIAHIVTKAQDSISLVPKKLKIVKVIMGQIGTLLYFKSKKDNSTKLQP